MTKKFIARGAFIAALLLLCLAAGIVGGIDFAADVALIRHFQEVRANSPGLTLAAIAVTQGGNAFATIGGGLGVSAWLAYRNQRWLAAVLGAAVIGERLVIDGMKMLIDRTRHRWIFTPSRRTAQVFPAAMRATAWRFSCRSR